MGSARQRGVRNSAVRQEPRMQTSRRTRGKHRDHKRRQLFPLSPARSGRSSWGHLRLLHRRRHFLLRLVDTRKHRSSSRKGPIKASTGPAPHQPALSALNRTTCIAKAARNAIPNQREENQRITIMDSFASTRNVASATNPPPHRLCTSHRRQRKQKEK